jgi:hypothetical protein
MRKQLGLQFHQIILRGDKKVKCFCCDKRLHRRKIFRQTQNPFNRNKDGDPKTYEEIKKELDKLEKS